MLNLKHHTGSATDFLSDVIKSKRNSKKDPTYTTRVVAMKAALKTHFGTYDCSFATDALHLMAAAGYTGDAAEDLLALYSYHSAIMQKLRAGVTTIDMNRVISTCQNCTIGEVNSFDHTVPKAEFPEFSVHPKNLFPSCSTCNGHKSKIWRDGGKRLFLNLYLDNLPSTQYLFVRVKISPKDIDVNFTIDNRNAIDPDLYEKIFYHYDKLKLCKRFKENVDRVITPLKHSVAANLNFLTEKQAIDTTIINIAKNRAAFGFNYWKSILETELISSPDFLTMCNAAK